MKKITLFLLSLIFVVSCSTFVSHYDYDRYFQEKESVIAFFNYDEAATHIAKKMSQIFKKMSGPKLAVIPFADETGDWSAQGEILARNILNDLHGYANLRIPDHTGLNKHILEDNLTLAQLVDDNGALLTTLLDADYILHGQLVRGEQFDEVSLRCFKAGSREVVYATTVSIERSPGEVYVNPQKLSPNPVPVKAVEEETPAGIIPLNNK